MLEFLQLFGINPLEEKLLFVWFVWGGEGVEIWVNLTSDGEVGITLDDRAIDRTKSVYNKYNQIIKHFYNYHMVCEPFFQTGISMNKVIT